MDDIAGDAELQEKSVADLKKLGERLVADCKDCLRESAEKNEEDKPEEKKQRNRWPSFKLSNVPVNAKAVLQSMEDLEILAKAIPTTEEERRAWSLDCQPEGHVRVRLWQLRIHENLLGSWLAG